MNLSRFRVLLLKEVRYIERDWRTLFMLFGFPFLAIPFALIVGSLSGQLGRTIEQDFKAERRREVARVAAFQVPDGSRLFGALRRQKQIEVIASPDPLRDLEEGRCDLVIEAPRNAAEVLRRKGTLRLRIRYDAGAILPWSAVSKALEEYGQDEMRARLGNLSLSADYLKPVMVEYEGASTKAGALAGAEKARKVVVPLLGLIVMLLVCAGCLSNYLFFLLEREEGTLETLLSNPVRPREILLAKWCAMLVFTTLQMALYAIIMVSAARLYGLLKVAQLFPVAITGYQVFLLVACLFQAAMFFYALLIVVCAVVQSAREANSMTGILTLCLFGLMAFPLLPVHPPEVFAILPLGGLSVAIREVLLGSICLKHWYAALISNLAYTAILLGAAGRLLGREEALVGGISVLRLTFERSRLVPRLHPSPSEALLLVLLVLPLFFYVAGPLQIRHLAAGHLVNQLGIFLLLPLGLALYLKIAPREAFRLRAPSGRAVACTLLLWAGWILVVPSFVGIQNRVIPMPDEISEQARRLLEGLASKYSLAAILGMGAVLPAVCEEMTFRGFVLSGFASRWRARWAVPLAALAFAFIHCDPWRFLPAFVLGVLMGILTVRSKSILPAILFHALNNGSILWIDTRFGEASPFSEPRWVGASALAGLLAMAVSLFLLFRPPPRRDGPRSRRG